MDEGFFFWTNIFFFIAENVSEILVEKTILNFNICHFSNNQNFSNLFVHPEHYAIN